MKHKADSHTMACIADPNSMKCDAKIVVRREGRPCLDISRLINNPANQQPGSCSSVHVAPRAP
jgi:hypothetical protein